MRKVINYFLIEWQKKRRTPVVLGYPYWLTIDPTNICNLRCPFCPTGQRRATRPPAKMSLARVKKILDRLGPYLFHIDFCNWGEPLLNKDIYSMIAYAKRYKIHTKLDSNFTIFDEESADELVGSGLDHLILSIDGASPRTYRQYRRGGDFNQVIENVKILVGRRRQLKQKTPFITWQFLVFRHNEHELAKAKRMAAELGVDEICFNTPFAADPAWIPKNPDYQRYRIDDKGEVSFKSPSPGSICNWLWDGITINSDGSVSPCCSVEDARDDFSPGRHLPFFILWNNRRYIAARKHVRDPKRMVKAASKNICERCDHIGVSNHVNITSFVADPISMIKSERLKRFVRRLGLGE